MSMARRLQSRIHPLEQADSGHTTRYREEQVGYGTAASPPPRNTVQETRRITLSPCERTTRGVRRGSGHGRMTCSPRYADPPATPSHGREGQTSPANAPPSNGQRKPLCRHRPSRLAWVETGARRRWACARTSTRICRRRSTWREHDARIQQQSGLEPSMIRPKTNSHPPHTRCTPPPGTIPPVMESIPRSALPQGPQIIAAHETSKPRCRHPGIATEPMRVRHHGRDEALLGM